uniref:FUSC family membrane protein n=1 Tax=Orrella sp. TaxID=1921583 RepID=UPI004048882E
MLGARLNRLQRFVYSHHFVGGLRRGSGVVVAFALVTLVLENPTAGLIAVLGALCVALIDQPGPVSVRIREMLGGLILGAGAVGITGLASQNPILLLIVVVAQSFFFSLFSVYGKRGGVIGLACLVLTVVTMHTSLTPVQAGLHTLTSVSGAVIYILVSLLSSRPLQVREEEQSLSVALFATADYVAARADMYEPRADIDEGYRRLIDRQSKMTEQHQAARDMILRSINPAALERSPRRTVVWNVFIDMVNMLDMLVSTHTDYTLLHRTLDDADIMIFSRDALDKMALELERIALAVTRERGLSRRNSVKAELRAIEFELEQMKRDGFADRELETYTICVQIFRRLRNVNRLIERMLSQTRFPAHNEPLNPAQIDASLIDFLSRQSFHPRLLSSNLRLDSPPCRFALRVALATAIGLGLGLQLPDVAEHGYWIVLTIIMIMKPAFSLTKQRNNARLTGTLIGCGFAYGLFSLTPETHWLLAALFLSLVAGFSFLLVNYLVASVFNTLAILLTLHFVFPSSFALINERAIDTVIGSLVAFACSYFLPWWESRSLPSLAQAAVRANQAFLQTAVQLLKIEDQDHVAAIRPNAWPLARRNTLVAFSNFAEAFYRMMGEPHSRQRHVAEYNHLLIQNHVLAAEILTIASLLRAQPEQASQAIAFMQVLEQALATRDLKAAGLPAPTFDRKSTPADWLYPLKQMQRAVQGIIRESTAIQTATQTAQAAMTQNSS